jgi:hypothetical protein
MKKLLLVSCISATVLLTACKGDEVSWQTQETQRAIAIENSEFNARNLRQKNKQYAGLVINGRGDSTISKNCANGDGWASVDLVDANGKLQAQLKCSTASANIGCLAKHDFDERSYASEEGRCNPDLPVPMPKIVK